MGNDSCIMSAAKRSAPHGTRIPALAAMLALLSACNFPADDGASVGGKGLWIANGTNVVEYLPGQLGGGATASAPHLAINSAAFGSPQGVTFDSAGNLWVMDPAGTVGDVVTPALFEFSAAQLAALPTDNAPDPIATITSAALKFPQQSAFDVNGNQWVTDHNNNTVLVFTAAELAQTGASQANPAMIISSAAFNGPLGIAFDSDGDLWVASNGTVPGAAGAVSSAGNTIVEFAAANLPALPEEGMIQPNLAADITLTDDGQASIQGPWALAFDATGNLWSSNANTPFTLVEFAKADLTATGAPVPVTIVSPATVDGNPSLNSPHGLCIDDVGNLAAVNSAGAFGVASFGQRQLTTGAPTPDTFLVGAVTTLNAPAGCNFGGSVNQGR